MSDSEILDRELREYLEKEPNLSRADRISYLKAIFDKQLGITKLDHMVNASDLFYIISDAKTQYTKQNSGLSVTKKRLDNSELVNVAIMESFISYLNRMGLTKKLVKFDYTG